MNALETEVLHLIGESVTAGDVFSDDATGLALIRGSLNDAIQEICAVTGGYHQPYYVPMIQDRCLYRMNWQTDYFGYVVQIWDRAARMRLTQTDVISLSMRGRQWMKETGDPREYAQIGFNNIIVFPKPSSSGKVLEMDCVAIPAAYTYDTDVIQIRENYRRCAVAYAVSEFYASRGDANRANEYYLKYAEGVGLKKIETLTQDQNYRYGNRYRVGQEGT